MIILIDMDGVIADFEGRVIEELNKNYPEIKIIVNRDKGIVDFYKERDEKTYKIIEKIIYSKSFIKNLKPIKGSKEALKYLLDKGNDVFICSSPLTKTEYSFSEKFNWIIDNLGEEWRRRLILVKDKTLIKGDILIDDKHDIKGLTGSSWEHIIFDQPYNSHITGKKRINWDNFKDVLKL
jgi:5'-nucleotidase